MQDLVQVRNIRNAANILNEPVVYSSSDMLNFLTTSNPNFSNTSNNTLEYQEPSRLMMHHHQQQHNSSFPHSLTDIHSSQHKQQYSYELVDVGNWRNNSVPHQVTDWFLNNANNSLACVHDEKKQLSHVMHHTPSVLYQNLSLQDIVKSTSITSNSSESHIASLMQLNGQSDFNQQSLSLSLSSNTQKNKSYVSHFEEGINASLDDPQYVRPSIFSRDCGKSLVGIIPSKSTISYGNVGPLGPFTGYATILKNSRFLKVAQNMLDEFCCSKFVIQTCDDSYSSSSMFRVPNESSVDWGARNSFGVSLKPDYQQNKAKLLYMQEEVSRRYKQYHQQMQMVFSSFESVAGLNSATPYIKSALNSVSKHFKCLNNSISNQLNLISDVLRNIPTTTNSSKQVDINVTRLRCMDQILQKNKPEKGITCFQEPQQQNVWKPQRGFPEPAVAILRAWLFEHFLHPYPTDIDKHMLATQTGLSRNQVSNWFINARVRLWKPMVEEVHMLDSKTTGASENSTQNEGTSGTDGGSSKRSMDMTLNKFVMHSIPENQIHDMELGSSIDTNAEENEINEAEQWNREKRSKLECEMSSRMDGTLMDFLPYVGHEGGGSLGPVSLTLGLRHGFEGVQHHYQQEVQLRHHLGGQMIHDFVG